MSFLPPATSQPLWRIRQSKPPASETSTHARSVVQCLQSIVKPHQQEHGRSYISPLTEQLNMKVEADFQLLPASPRPGRKQKMLGKQASRLRAAFLTQTNASFHNLEQEDEACPSRTNDAWDETLRLLSTGPVSGLFAKPLKGHERPASATEGHRQESKQKRVSSAKPFKKMTEHLGETWEIEGHVTANARIHQIVESRCNMLLRNKVEADKVIRRATVYERELRVQQLAKGDDIVRRNMDMAGAWSQQAKQQMVRTQGRHHKQRQQSAKSKREQLETERLSRIADGRSADMIHREKVVVLSTLVHATLPLLIWGRAITNRRERAQLMWREAFLAHKYGKLFQRIFWRRKRERTSPQWLTMQRTLLLIRIQRTIQYKRNAIWMIRDVFQQWSECNFLAAKTFLRKVRSLQGSCRRLFDARKTKLQFILLQMDRFEVRAVMAERQRDDRRQVSLLDKSTAAAESDQRIGAGSDGKSTRGLVRKVTSATGARSPKGRRQPRATSTAVQRFEQDLNRWQPTGIASLYPQQPARYSDVADGNFPYQLYRCPYFLVRYNVGLKYYLNERGLFLAKTREYLSDKRAWEFQRDSLLSMDKSAETLKYLPPAPRPPSLQTFIGQDTCAMLYTEMLEKWQETEMAWRRSTEVVIWVGVPCPVPTVYV
uniref:Uncharacterized protein n=1 Tax=Eutreptiella gymnastica TaxID=73025 RepID=A0A7S1IKY5_9EUGL|mmetsp:Transcript_26450/g.47653  ORF Transcript_26450/g.47653 Transcript_26450/m.47653 type:complete len:658 (+) Transcript_26450:106-2079(+)